MLTHALKLVRYGFHVFPLQSNSKLPAIPKFYEKACKTEEEVRATNWFGNVGISTTHFGEGFGLIGIDVDNKGAKVGDESLLCLELEGKIFPKTFTQTTPSGGRHLIYKCPHAVRQGVNVLGPGLDIRSHHGYLVGAGSVIGGGIYEADFAMVADAPPWLMTQLSAKRVLQIGSTSGSSSPVPPEAAFERGKTFLLNEAEIAKEGEGGDLTTFRVAARLKDIGCSYDACVELMSDFWNPKCEPPWSHGDLRAKVLNAFKYGNSPQGSSSPESDFKPEAPVKGESPFDVVNKRFALVFVDKTYSIIEEMLDHKGEFVAQHLEDKAFRKKLTGQKIEVDGKVIPLADAWLNSTLRREYKGEVFYPGEIDQDYYNLWRGFRVKPLSYEEASDDAKRGFNDFLDHTFENICQGNEEYYEWIMNYFAHLFKYPHEKPLTTVAFKGLKGVGKNAFIERIMGMLRTSNQYLTNNSRYLVSNFNSHMEAKLLFVLDEAVWGGDKAADAILKGLTTGSTLQIEKKGREPYTVDNFVRVVMIGNEDWLVPASMDERRYAVFQVGDKRKQDLSFFEDMRINMDSKGGNRVLLDYFQTFDVDRKLVNLAPNTDALSAQKEETLSNLDAFMLDSLCAGKILNYGYDDESQPWPKEVPREEFRFAFKRYLDSRKINSRIDSDVKIGRRIRPFLRDDAGDRFLNRYPFKSLEEARRAWEEMTRRKQEWN